MSCRRRVLSLLWSATAVASLSCGTARPSATSTTGPAMAGATAPAPAEEPSPGFRLPRDTRPLAYTLALDVDPAQESFAGTVKIRVQLDAPRRTLWLHARNLDVKTAVVAGSPARFAQVDDDGMARLALDTPVGPGPVDVELTWSAKMNPALESLYRVSFEGAWYAFTQFEAISAREAFPCFDEPGWKTPFSLSLTTKPGDLAVANTAETGRTRRPDGRTTTTFAPTEPLPTYLVAFGVGPFDVVEGKPLPPNDIRKEPVPIRGITARGKGKLVEPSLAVTAEVLSSLERWFGIPYPYDKLDMVAVPDFSAGAMENAGFVTFKDQFLFVDDKSPIGLQKANVGIIAHELAHQWFGNYVTMAWWDDLWLNEAFASWLPVAVIEEIRPAFGARVNARAELDWVTGQDSLVTARQIRQPIEGKGDILNAFDGITYDKGQSVISMFERWVGAATFQEGVRAYLRGHAHGNATARDLLDAVSAAAHKDVATPFSTFLDKPGVPYVAAKLVCDTRAKTAVVELTQERFLPLGSTGERGKTWQLPVCVRVEPSKKDGDAPRVACTLLTDKKGTLPLDAKTCPRAIHPNADGAGYYRWSLPPEQLQALSRTLPALSPGERISYGNAIRAGESAGTLPFAEALAAALPLARDEEPTIADTPLALLSFAWRELVEPEARPKVEQKIIATYKPVLDAVKLLPKANEDPRARERRTLALSALAAYDDPQTLAALAKIGATVLGTNPGGDGKLHLDKAPGDIVSLAVWSAVKKGGAAAWEDANTRLGTESDSTVRRYLLGALAGVHDEALATRARDLALDPRLKTNEVGIPLGTQARDVRTRDATWAWLPAKYEALKARYPESWADAALADAFGGFCSDEKAAEIEAFFRAQRNPTSALDMTLRQTVESVKLCAARKKAHQESARRLFPKK